jgi:hypothetical protein
LVSDVQCNRNASDEELRLQTQGIQSDAQGSRTETTLDELKVRLAGTPKLSHKSKICRSSRQPPTFLRTPRGRHGSRQILSGVLENGGGQFRVRHDS